MLKEFVEKIIELGDGRIQTAFGRAYTRSQLIALPSPSDKVEPIQLHTLTGLCEYVKAKFDETMNLGIVVEGPAGVRVVSKLFGQFRQRDCYAVAAPYTLVKFPFGQWLNLETFIVSLQANFVLDEQVAKILKVIGNVEGSDVANWDDDGVTQEVTVRSGIANKSRERLPNPVTLAPYRTFQEIEQPTSQYILRMKRDEEKEPTISLTEVLDNRWQVEAGDRIAKLIGRELRDIPIFV